MTARCKNVGGNVSKVSFLSLILLYVFISLRNPHAREYVHDLSIPQSDCKFGLGSSWSIWGKVFKYGRSKLCERQPSKILKDIYSNFLKVVFHKFDLVHS